MLLKTSRSGNAQVFSAFEFFSKMGPLCNKCRRLPGSGLRELPYCGVDICHTEPVAVNVTSPF
jgi:hypothetical protein